MSANRPNILLITSHDIGRHLGCYGVSTVHTPALDRLAQEGVRFERAYCPSPFCSPSRASIFTGRYPHSTGVNGLTHGGFGWDMNDDEIHLARYLSDAGYRCEQFGTMHETHRPAERWGYAQHHVAPQGTAAEIADIACQRIRDLAPSRAQSSADAGKSWYIHIGFFEPHTPFNWGGATPDDSRGVTVPTWLVNDEPARQRFAAFQGAIRSLNAGVERVLAALEQSGQADNTLVLFTADHGIPFPRAKGSLYEAGLEVALLLRWPARGWVGGRVQRELVAHLDHVPMILDTLGIARPSRLQGRSYRPLLDREPFVVNPEVFAELTFFNRPFYNPRRGVRTDRYRLILNATTDQPFSTEDGVRPIPQAAEPWQRCAAYGDVPALELYDLDEDPLQLHNLSERPEYAEILADLKARLFQWMQATADPLLHGVPTPPSQTRALSALADAGV